MPPKHILNNEGKACDAVVKVLEKRTGEKRSDIRHPESTGEGPPVDLRLKLGDLEYALEHTRIEPFENQIKTTLVSREISYYLQENVSGHLPKPMYYILDLPVEVSLPDKREKRRQALKNLADWIQRSSQLMHTRNFDQPLPTIGPNDAISPYWRSDDNIKGKPEGLNCTVELLRWRHALPIRRTQGSIDVKLPDPEDVEDLRTERIRRAFCRKFPKLSSCKIERTRTVLVLENRDATLTRFDLVGTQLPNLLAERLDQPDEIFLVETYTNLWWVYLMKLDDEHWPTVGMPQWNRPIYDPDNLPTAGLPKWYRDAFRLDEEYAPYLTREWIPATFEKNELDNITLLLDH